MKKIFYCLSVIFLVASSETKGQTGDLKIWIQTEGILNSVKCELYKDSLLLQSKTDTNCCPVFFSFPNIATGIYAVRIYYNDTLNAIHYGIDIRKDKEAFVHIYPFWTEYLFIQDRDTIRDQFGFDLTFLVPDTYSDRDQTPFNSSYEIGFTEGPRFSISKHLVYLLNIGSSFSITNIKKGASVFYLPAYDKERYFYWKVDIESSFRITGYNNQRPGRGFIFDIGLAYDLPLVFRHVIIDGNLKYQTRKIHTFNDVAVIARIGWLPFSIQAEYTLTTFLKENYPEIPRLKFGVSFLLENL